MKKQGPAIYLETDGGPLITIVLVDTDGREQRCPTVTPAEDLLSVLAIDYSEYRNAVSDLWDTHSLFEARMEVYVHDHKDMIAKALALLALLKDCDPVAHLAVTARLNEAVQYLPALDDNSAIFLLNFGGEILKILADPIRTQIRLRNVFEVAFDGMERATQRERFEKLTKTYPELLDKHYYSRWVETSEGSVTFGNRLEYTVGTLYDLRILELILYFRQEEQRIARCEYCWDYFIPKTKKQTCYCDRQFGNKICKQLGPNLKRNLGPEQDEALRLFEILYSRMAARRDRYEMARPDERDKLIPLTDLQFHKWSEDAGKARMDYLQKKISAKEFLRAIDMLGELDGYDVGTRKLPELSEWQKYVYYHIDFDPAKQFQPMQYIDLGQENPRWQNISPEEQIRAAQQGHQSLRGKYDKGL